MANHTTNSSTGPDDGNPRSVYYISGAAGGGFILFMSIVTVLAVTCCRRKRKAKTQSDDIPDVLLDQPVLPAADFNPLEMRASENFQRQMEVNIKKVIGKTLARDMENIILDPNRLITGEKLGEGNFGVVHSGVLKDKDGTNPRKVAVKSIPYSAVSSETLSAFIAEVLRMRHFNHVNVLSLCGLVIQQNMPKVIMPHMSEGDLRCYVADGSRTLYTSDMIDLARQVAAGMQYLASQNFIHRDLAARNCLVDSGPQVKVADFGLSRDLFNEMYYTTETNTQLPVRWMAVESLADKKFSTKSDVWSFGVLLWELFSRGEMPYRGLDGALVKQYVLKGQRMACPPSMPERIWSLTEKCWNTHTRKRPTFSEIVCDLQDMSPSDLPPSYDDIKWESVKSRIRMFSQDTDA